MLTPPQLTVINLLRYEIRAPKSKFRSADRTRRCTQPLTAVDFRSPSTQF
ncbi:hypothetical protein [Rubritalea tangerina]